MLDGGFVYFSGCVLFVLQLPTDAAEKTAVGGCQLCSGLLRPATSRHRLRCCYMAGMHVAIYVLSAYAMFAVTLRPCNLCISTSEVT